MLSGRVALVTGGSGGIGAVLCARLAAEGMAVAVHFRDRAERAEAIVAQITGAGGRACAIPADLLVPRASDLLVDAVERELGPVDALVANHGLAHRATYDEVDVGAWDETLAINLRAPYLLARRVLPGMRERGWGRLLFVSSVAALTGGIVGPHYAASKAGLIGLTHHFAARVAERHRQRDRARPDRAHRHASGRPRLPGRQDPHRAARPARGDRRHGRRDAAQQLPHEQGGVLGRRAAPALRSLAEVAL